MLGGGEKKDRGCSSGGDKNWPKFGLAIYLPLFGFIKRTNFLSAFMARKRGAVNLREIVPETVKVIPWTVGHPSLLLLLPYQEKLEKKKKRTVGHTHLEKQDIATDKDPSSSFFCPGGIFPGNAATVINETLSSPSSSSSLFKLTFLRLSLVVQRF